MLFYGYRYYVKYYLTPNGRLVDLLSSWMNDVDVVHD